MNAKWMRVAIYPTVLALATVGVYLMTHDGSAALGAGATSHAAGAGAKNAAAAKPVTLSAADARRIGVTFATVARGPLRREVRTVGQITVDETRVRAISPRIDGWVERLYVNATGQPVVEGQPLLTIYSPMLVSAQEELLLAKRLAADVSAADAGARQRAAELVAAARRRLAYWDVDERDIDEIERTGMVRRALALRARTSGYVLEKNVLAGQRIMAGDAIYRVADLRTVWLEGEVFEQDLASVRVGQTVRAELQALPGTQRTGRIAYLYPTLNPDTRTARVRVVLSNEGLALKPGMYATIRVAAMASDATLSVPRSAVLSTGDRSIVFVRAATGQLAPREVALGATSEDRVEILRGVTAGETVVASATFLIDAESNLGTALGGMGDMPGMDLVTPPKALDSHDHAPR